jgi:peptide/nickel transport system ATP-binding protein
VGESGSGKSSLAKCIVGLLEPSSGSIEVAGRDLTASQRPLQLRRQIQMVFQNPDTSLNPRRSLRYTLDRGLKLLAGLQSRAVRNERMLELARSVMLQPHHLDQRPAALSGGLKQRAAIAGAFVGHPELVLCDEPTSALDVSVQAAILNLLADLQAKANVAYILISHDLGVVRYLADRIGVMYLGELIEVGEAEQVFNPPHHPYTEALVSAMPMVEPASATRILLTGPSPSAADPPSGCRFHTRCPRVLGDLCRTEEPPWQRHGDHHSYKCHISPISLAAAQGTEHVVSAEDPDARS